MASTCKNSYGQLLGDSRNLQKKKGYVFLHDRWRRGTEPSSKKDVLQMVETSCANDRKAKELYPNISDGDLIRRRRLHFARACGYYLAGQGRGEIRP